MILSLKFGLLQTSSTTFWTKSFIISDLLEFFMNWKVFQLINLILNFPSSGSSSSSYSSNCSSGSFISSKKSFSFRFVGDGEIPDKTETFAFGVSTTYGKFKLPMIAIFWFGPTNWVAVKPKSAVSMLNYMGWCYWMFCWKVLHGLGFDWFYS